MCTDELSVGVVRGVVKIFELKTRGKVRWAGHLGKGCVNAQQEKYHIFSPERKSAISFSADFFFPHQMTFYYPLFKKT